MKESNRASTVCSIMIVFLLMGGVFGVASMLETSSGLVIDEGLHRNEISMQTQPVNSPISILNNYNPSQPIRINSNEEFAAHSTGGDGSPENPWIIENLEINGTGHGYGIFIGNTTDHSIVRNSLLYAANGSEIWPPENAEANIMLYNVTNGSIINNTVSDSWDGISIILSENIFVSENNVSDNSAGITLGGSSNNIIEGNSVISNSAGIFLYHESNNNIISENVAVWNLWAGIVLYERNHDNIISHNNASGNGHGAHLLDSTGCVLTNNNFSHNQWSGVYIENSSFHIANNTMNNNGWAGIEVVNPAHSYRTIENNGYIIQAGDNLQYEVMVAPTSDSFMAGVDFICTDETNMRDNDFLDQHGLGAHPSTDLSHVANGVWYHRIIDISAFEGKTIDEFATALEGDYGMTIAYFKNIAITNNDIIQHVVFDDALFGSGDVSAVGGENRYTNVSLGMGDVGGEPVIEHRGRAMVSENRGVISGCEIHGNSEGIFVKASSNIEIYGCNISHNQWNGIYLERSNGNTIATNTVLSNTGHGIALDTSSNNLIRSNNIMNNTENGILLCHQCSENVIEDNTAILNGEAGIALWEDCHNNSIIGNTASDNMRNGILIYHSSGNTIVGNNASNNSENGIYFHYSNDNTVSGFTAVENNYTGIALGEKCNNNTLVQNTASDNVWDGISLVASNNNTLVQNTASDNGGYGIKLNNSNHNQIVDNTISNNSYWAGLGLNGSHNNTITGNSILSNGGYGAVLENSASNRIYHNTFVDNTEQAFDDGNNTWDNGYPGGGNYWSDHAGQDLYNGPGQDILGADGIWDTPYEIEGDGGAQDNYPWTNQQFMPPGVDYIRLTDSPNGMELSSITMDIGETLVVYSSSYNNTLGYMGLLEIAWFGVDNAWENTTGKINTYTAGTIAGVYEQAAGILSLGVGGFLSIEVPHGPAANVALSSESVVVVAGEALNFTVEVYDAHGNFITDNATLLIWENATKGVFNNTLVGEYDVVATYENATPSIITVTVVHSGIASVVLSSESDVVVAGEALNFTAAAYDIHGNLITDNVTLFTWENATKGVLYEEEAGRYRVAASYQGIPSSTIAVDVTAAAVTMIVVSPSSAAITADETTIFTFTAYDAFNNLVSAEIQWSSTNGSIINGRFSPWRTGTITVTATAGAVVGEAVVLVSPGKVTRIEIHVSNSTIDSPTDFTATCYDRRGNMVDAVVSWSTDDPKGRITSDGYYTPGEPGTWFVTARHHQVTESLAITVEEPASEGLFTIGEYVVEEWCFPAFILILLGLLLVLAVARRLRKE